MEATCTGDLLEAYCHQVETCTQIALSCVETDSYRRPDIVTITMKLNKIEIDVDEVINIICIGIQWVARIEIKLTTVITITCSVHLLMSFQHIRN